MIVFFFFLIGIHSMQGCPATARYEVTRKRNAKRLRHTDIHIFQDNFKCAPRTHLWSFLCTKSACFTFLVSLLFFPDILGSIVDSYLLISHLATPKLFLAPTGRVTVSLTWFLSLGFYYFGVVTGNLLNPATFWF